MGKLSAVFIFPNGLFENNHLIDKDSTVYFIEHPVYFSSYAFHKLKLIFHRASMKKYAHDLEDRIGCQVIYHEFHHDLDEIFKSLTQKKVAFYDPWDHDVMKDLICRASTYSVHMEVYDSLLFMNSKQEFQDYVKDKRVLRHDDFYRWQRVKHNVLIEPYSLEQKSISSKRSLGDATQGHGSAIKPCGGAWSFDNQNREPFPEGFTDVYLPHQVRNNFVDEAIDYVAKYFSSNPGSEHFTLMLDHAGAKKIFKNFLITRLGQFGPYQDAVAQGVHYGYHSVISPLLNVGLLTPGYIVKETEKFGRAHDIPLASLEGFLRQVIGWREYVALLYCTKRTELYSGNYFNHRQRLPKVWWQGLRKNQTTGFTFIDEMIDKVFATGYLHHIERLMYIGNWMLLASIDPQDAYNWFMTMFIDSYAWVMAPNVFGMSQYSTGPLMMTRPYFSSAHYIDKMSDYKKRRNIYPLLDLDNTTYEWFVVWDALYYDFIGRHTQVLINNYATARQVAHWNRKTEQEQRDCKAIAKKYRNAY